MGQWGNYSKLGPTSIHLARWRIGYIGFYRGLEKRFVAASGIEYLSDAWAGSTLSWERNNRIADDDSGGRCWCDYLDRWGKWG